jgi:tetratricopeptide (TPR) repeat protein
VRENPTVAWFKEYLADCHFRLGIVQRDAGQGDLALRSFEEARVLQEELVQTSSEDRDFQSNLAETLSHIGRTQLELGQAEQAVQALQGAIRAQRLALGNAPQVVGYRESLRESYRQLARAQGERGCPAEIVQVACELARCLSVFAEDGAESQPTWTQKYADQALETLRQALAAGYTDAEHLKRDQALDPLRTRPDFRELVREVEEKGKLD